MVLDLALPEREGGRAAIDNGLDLGRIAQTERSAKRTVIVSGELDNISVGSALESLDLSTTQFERKGSLNHLGKGIVQALAIHSRRYAYQRS